MDGERLDIRKTLAYLTLDEKIRMLDGFGMWQTFATGEIPSIRMSDGPNGLRMSAGALGDAVPAVCYPTEGMLANSWDPALIYNIGAELGKEATALGVNLLLAPGVNIKRNPLGGRNFEYFSEDPLLSGTLGRAYIAGVQSTGVGACVKHFAANNQEYMRMYSNSIIDERALFELYLEPFRIALEAKPEAVMCAYNKLNGEYCSQNRRLLTEILREKWEYGGAVISDWGAVRDRAQALAAGLDLAMPDSNGLFEKDLRNGLENGTVTEDMIDASIARILTLIDNVYLEPYGEYTASDELAYNAAAASIVMLKNDNDFLPLTKDKKITVCGELAENAPIQGGGSSHVTPLKTITPLQALSMRGVEFSYFVGYSANADKKQSEKLLHEAVEGSAESDCVIVYVGQPAPAEGCDRDSLELPEYQNRLISELTAAGRRVVAVLCSTGPVLMPWVSRVRSVVYAGLNGCMGALVAADVLFGRINPCGKTAETFPASEPNKRDFGVVRPLYRESIFVGYKYYEACGITPLFPFGHGLSFSNIAYTDIHVTASGEDCFDVTVTIENRSSRDACETVQIYIAPPGDAVPHVKKYLAGYVKIFAEGLTSASATVRLDRHAFEFYDVSRHAYAVYGGRYELLCGASATDIRLSATVSVTGDFDGKIEYPPSYSVPNIDGISDEDFSALLGHAPPPEQPRPVKKQFTLDSCINDIAECTVIGKIIRFFVLKRLKSQCKKDSPEYGSLVANALNTPLSGASAMSDGALPLKTAEGIVALANGKFFGGLKKLLGK